MKKIAEPVRPSLKESETATPVVPRHAGVMAVVVHLAAALVLSWPALGGKLLLNLRSDQFKAGYAFRDFARQHWLDYGSVPQWNPYLFGGMPFVDAMHGDTFYPTALLRLVMGTGAGMTWGLIIHLFFAGLFTYFFLRACRLSFYPALMGGVAYEMAGNIAGLVSPGHDGKMFVAALLPLALLLVTRGIRDARHWAWGPLALVVGLAVLSPHPQLLQYMLLLTGAFALFLWRGLGSDRGDPEVSGRAGLQRLGLALASIGVGLSMGAIQFYPVTKYTAWSPRAGGIGYESGTTFSMPPEETINFALPQFSGILDAYWGRNNIHLHSEYIGIAVLVLAGIAFGGWAVASHRRLVWFLAATLVVSLLWALGGYTPFYRIVYALVPGTRFFRAPSTMLYIVSFAFACLAAFGTERLLRGRLSRTYLAAAAAAITLLGILGVSGMLTNSALGIGGSDRAEFILANEPALTAGAIRMMLFGLLACLTIYLAAARKLSKDLAGTLLIVLVAADLWSVVRQYFLFSPPARELFAADPSIEFLQKQPGPFRVVSFPPRRGNPNDMYLQQLNYDGLMVHRIPVVLGYQGNHLARYDLLTGAGEGFRQLGNPSFWRLANVRYLLSDEPELPIDSARRVLGPVKNSQGNEVYVYEAPVAASYAWVTAAIVTTSDEQSAAVVLDPRFTVRSVAFFDSSANVPGVTLQSLPAPLAVEARVTRYQPGAATIELDTPAPAGSALVVSENYYPGWQATVDGKPARIGRANVSLIGVALPEGARKIELAFVNRPYQTGRTVTWAAVLLALAMWTAGAFTSRGRTARD